MQCERKSRDFHFTCKVFKIFVFLNLSDILHWCWNKIIPATYTQYHIILYSSVYICGRNALHVIKDKISTIPEMSALFSIPSGQYYHLWTLKTLPVMMIFMAHCCVTVCLHVLLSSWITINVNAKIHNSGSVRWMQHRMCQVLSFHSSPTT